MYFIFSLFLLLCTTEQAYAYIDPSSSLMALQGVLAFLGSLIIFIKNPLQTILSLFAKIKTMFKRNA